VALQAFAEDPLGDWPRAYAERLASEAGNWAALAQAYETALPDVLEAEPMSALPLLSTLARAYERELADAESAIARNRKILELSPEDEEAVFALERLYIATERYPELLAIYDKKLSLAAARPRSARSASAWPTSTRSRSATPTRPSSSTGPSSTRRPTRCRRCGPSIGLYRGTGSGRSWPPPSSASWSCPTTTPPPPI
jgi:tetratricopeptide (TPR) repeat protein